MDRKRVSLRCSQSLHQNRVNEVKGKVEIFLTYFSGKYDLTLTNESLNKIRNGLATDVWSKTLATRFLDYLG